MTSSKYFTAFEHIYRQKKESRIKRWVAGIAIILMILLFLPWTQNVRARGAVTTLKQEHRPQQINTIIGGRIEKWFVKEGDYVSKGDTIVQLSEIKGEYLDPLLLQRTQRQILAKKSAVDYYENKISTTGDQIKALQASRQAKLEQLDKKYNQAMVKLQSDSMDMIAAANDWRIASLQFDRQRALYDSGLVSLTQLEQRNGGYQSAIARKTSAENKFLASKQELGIVQIEFNAVKQEYEEKESKAEGERFLSLSSVVIGEGDIAKLENQYANYAIRNGMYYVIAPQSGQVIKARKSGIGELLKESDMLVHIVPDKVDYAVELYVRPVDLPLLSPGNKVRFLFDGFPAIVFSGWPQASYGTFQGIVSSIENDISENGKFRVLVMEDASYRKWPKELKMGSGASGIALLKNVSVWYELWRNINSFPPDYYKQAKKEEEKK